MAAAETLADVAAAYLLNANAREELLAAFESLQQSALHDPLTGLVNRLLLQDRIEHATQIASRSGTIAAILFVNIDGFKLINETHGRQLGDQLLRAVAERLVDVVSPADTLARFTDDKFVILCEHMDSADDVDGIVRRVDAALQEPFTLIGADEPLRITATIGVVFADSAGAMSHDLVVKADKAMRKAKKDHDFPHQIIDFRAAVTKHATGPLRLTV